MLQFDVWPLPLQLMPEEEAGEGREQSIQEIEENKKDEDEDDVDMTDDGQENTLTTSAPNNQNTSETQQIQSQSKVRTQLIIPVSSASNKITPALLQTFFSVRGVQVQQMILGLVDSNGIVSRCCMYNYIQAPLEGPGTANLQLLDD